MYVNVETHKRNNPVRVITNGCNAAAENFSIFVENVLFELVSQLPSRIKDTCHILEIIDDINNSNLSSGAILVSFEVVNMFPSIDDNMRNASVRKYLDERECNNSVVNSINYLQTDGTA